MLGVLLILASCKKDNVPNPPEGTKLVRIVTTGGPDSVGTTYFNYNAAGDKLMSIYDTLLPAGFATRSTFSYNTSGVWTGTEDYQRFLSYTFNSANTYTGSQMTGKVKSSPAGNLERNAYSYYPFGGLMTDTLYKYPGPQESELVKFLYVGNEDVSEWERFYKASGIWQSYGYSKPAYLSSANPFYPVGLGYYFVKADKLHPDLLYPFLSKHLVDNVVHLYGKTTYSYTFNSNGLPKKATIVQQYNAGGSKTITIEFFYSL